MSRESDERLWRLASVLRIHQNATDRLDEAACALLGINRTDGRCLDILDRMGRMSAGALGAEAGLSSGAVTAMVDRLEKAGYLRRVPDPGDRRRVLVEVTERAGQIAGLIYGRFQEVGQAMMAEMDAAQMAFVTRFLLISSEMNLALARRLAATTAEAREGTEPMALARRFSEAMKGEAEAVAAAIPEAVDAAEAALTPMRPLR
ncbi:MarR family transcriptional regulator [Pseudoroseicyclus sp. CXY001]|uniref:MarR family transcriptional regulator n=1 Tax=Pseudoroseicyclus sp. CXY001 TaxID=3242492 RepID=UPI00358DCE37